MKYIFLLALIYICAFGSVQSETVIISNINSPAEFTLAGSPYKIMKSIEVNSLLKIQKGVEIFLDKGVSIEVSGRIQAIGSSDSLIKFSAISSNPSEHWGKLIMLESPMSERSRFEFCEFINGGFSGTTPIEFRSVIFPILRHIEFANNKKNAIEIHTDVIKYGAHLTECGVPYTIPDNCYIEQNYDLVIDPGVVVKLPASWFVRVRGNVIARGTPQKPIIFTSMLDDEADGIDTDNLGPITSRAGDWGGFILEGSINHAKTIFRSCIFKYGGGSMVAKQSFLFFYNSMCSIDYCTFESSAAHAVSTFADAYPDLGGGHLNSHGHNKFIGFDSPKYAVSNQTDYTIFAKYNCWGTTDSAAIGRMCQTLPGAVIASHPLVDCSAASPDKPNLLIPKNLTNMIDTNATFVWSDTPFTDSYTIQLSKLPDFSAIDFEYNFINDSLIRIENMKANTQYYWRVAGENIFGLSQWADYWSFRTLDNKIPAPAAKVFPDSNYQFTFCDVNLKWHPVPSSVLKYEIQVSEYIDFSRLSFADSTANDTLSNPELSAGTKYYWRVRAKNNIGWGNWSDTTSFITRQPYKLEPMLLTNEIVKKAFSADVNGDGIFDIILETPTGTFLYRNQSNSAFSSHQIPNLKTITQLEFADFNKDNRLDFAILGTNKLGIPVFKIYRFDGTNVVSDFELSHEESAKIAHFAIGNIFGSGNKDIVIKSDDSDTLLIIRNLNGELNEAERLAIGAAENDFIIKDIDNNGTDNILFESNSRTISGYDSTSFYSIEIINNQIISKYLGGTKTNSNDFYHIHNSHFSDIDGNGFYDFMSFKFANQFLIGEFNPTGLQFGVLNSKTSPMPIDRYSSLSNNISSGQFIDIDYDGGNDFFVQDSNTFKIFDTKNHIINGANLTIDSINNFKYQALYSDYERNHVLGIRNDSLFVLRNNNCELAQSPSFPVNLKQIISGNDMIFEWELSDETMIANKSQNIGGSLNGTRSFNIKIGTYPGGNDVVMPECDPITGKLFSLKEGNAAFRWQYLIKDLPAGKYYWSVQSIDAAYRYSDFSLEHSFEIRDTILNVPAKFAASKMIDGASTRIAITGDEPAKLDNQVIPDGSIIAAFISGDSSLALQGYDIIDANRPLRLTVWGNLLPSFDENDLGKIEYYLWNKETNQIDFIKANYDLLLPNQNNVEYQFAKLSIKDFSGLESQTIKLDDKKWQFISSYLLPQNSKTDSVLMGRNLSMLDGTGSIYESIGKKEIEKWNNFSAYKVYSNLLDSLKIIGTSFEPASRELTLGKGWQMIAYPYRTEMPIDSVFRALSGNAAIYNSLGQLYFPSKGINTISNVSPGEGLRLYTEQDSLKFRYRNDWSFNPNSKDDLNASKFLTMSPQTGNEMFAIIECDLAKMGDEIAVSNGNHSIIGAAKFDGSIAVLTIWGDDKNTPDIAEGAIDDEPLFLHYYSSEKNSIYSVPSIDTIKVLIGDNYTDLQRIRFDTDHIVSTKIDLSLVVSVSEPTLSHVQVFPNPAYNSLSISGFISERPLEYTISNPMGETVLVGKYETMIDVSSLSSGVYVLRIGSKILKFVKI